MLWEDTAKEWNMEYMYTLTMVCVLYLWSKRNHTTSQKSFSWMNIPIALVFDKGTLETTCIYIVLYLSYIDSGNWVFVLPLQRSLLVFTMAKIQWEWFSSSLLLNQADEFINHTRPNLFSCNSGKCATNTFWSRDHRKYVYPMLALVHGVEAQVQQFGPDCL